MWRASSMRYEPGTLASRLPRLAPHVEPVVERQREPEPADQRQQREPVPAYSADGMPREVRAEERERHERVEDETKRELVTERGTEAVVLVGQPDDEQTVRDEQSEQRDQQEPHGTVPPSVTARRSAARASSRVESSVGRDAFASFTMSGSSVQPRITASAPSDFMRAIVRCSVASDSGFCTPRTSSSMMMRWISSRSAALGRTISSPRAASFGG